MESKSHDEHDEVVLTVKQPKASAVAAVEDAKPKTKEKEVHAVSILKLFSFGDRIDYLLMLVGSTFAIGGGATLPLFNLVMGKLVDTLNEGTSMVDNLRRFVKILSYIGGGAAVGTFIMVLTWSMAGERQAMLYKTRYVGALLRQDLAFFDEHPAGELPTIATAAMAKVQDGLGKKTGDVIFYMSMFVTGIAVAFYSDAKLAGVMLATLPLMAAGMSVVIIAMSKSAASGQKYYGKAGGVANEVFGAIRTVAALCAEPIEIKRYSEHLEFVEKNGISEGMLLGMGQGVTFLTFFGAFGLAFWYGSRQVADSVEAVAETGQCNKNCVSGGEVLSAVFSILIGAQALGLMQPGLNALTLARTAAASLFSTIDRVPAIDSADPGGDRLGKVEGRLELREVGFRYPMRPDNVVYSGMSLSVKPGETLALVGPSGGGKSTMTKLLLRFYDVTEGALLLDGHDIRTLNVMWYREQIGYVGQEPVLFNGSIRDNIRNGKPGCSEAEVETAAAAANAHNFILSFPAGYDTEVGHFGVQLSGGQKQRIAIARAVVRDPAILLLDEATSALDSESEKVVQKALDDLHEQHRRTTITIAHRLSTIQGADRIAVIAEGGVMEIGKHEKLLAMGGMYAALVNAQRGGENGSSGGSRDRGASGSGVSGSSGQHRHSRSESEARERERSSSRSVQQAAGAIAGSVSVGTGARIQAEASDSRPGVMGGFVTSIFSSRKASASNASAGGAADAVGANGGGSGGGGAEGEEAAEAQEPLRKVDRMRIWDMNRPEAGHLVLGFLGACIVGMIFPVEGLILASTQSSYYLSTAQAIRDEGDKWAAVFAGLGGCAIIGHVSLAYGFATAGEKLVRRIREMCFEAMVRQPVFYFDREENSVGRLTTRLETEAATVKEATGWALGNKIQLILTLLGGVIIALVYCWQIGLLALALVPMLAVAGVVQSALITGRYNGDGGLDGGRTAGAVLGGALGGISTVMAYNMQDAVGSVYTTAVGQSIESRKRRGIITAAAFGYSQGAIFLAFALLFQVGGHLIDRGQTTFEDFFVALFSTILGCFGVGNINSEWGAQGRGEQAAQRIFDLADAPRPIDPLGAGGAAPAAVRGDLSFRGLMFSYPTRPDLMVYGGPNAPTGFNLEVAAGQTVALVGPSGGGKSTCIALLLRFYEAASGSILLDGRDVRELKVHWLRSRMGYVGQEPVLFMGTIRENIFKGNPEATPEEVEQAAKAANAHDFIMTFPDGYDTDIGEKSALLSGGQKQRIAIARAIVGKPAILLLDEATSALDNTSERIVQEALDGLQAKQQSTCLVVAHRLTTICNADQIAVVADGGVRELGTHKELLQRKDGVYAALWNRQMGTPS